MGQLGYGYDQALDTPMPAIEDALESKWKMLKACFGAGDAPAPQVASRPMSPALFDAIFRGDP